MLIGYARVSTDGQTLDAQLAALHSAGCERVFSEKISGAKTDRAALVRALKAPGPTRYVDRDPAGQARQKHQGPPERPRSDRRGWRHLSVAC